MHRLAILICLLAPLGVAQDTVAGAEPQHPSVAAFKGTLRNTVERKGTFIPAEFEELKLDFEAYKGELRLADMLEHGSFVNEGDTIARFETKTIDEQVERARMALQSSEMALRHAEAGAREQAAKAAEALANAQRGADRAAKRLRGYREHEKKHRDESERLSIQWRKHSLENQKDELDQLEKMYAEDELVDATEEIVLKRQRRSYARSVANFDLSERRRLYRKEWYEQEKEEDLETRAEQAAANLERLQASQARAREKTEASLKKKRFDLAKQREQFADLERDRESFVVRAPRAGILLHGAADAAPWTKEYEKGDTLRNRTPLATVADPKKYVVKTDVEEKDLLRVKSGAAVEIAPTMDEERKLMGRLRMDYLPGKGGKLDAEVRLGKSDVRLRPGLTCKVSIILGEARDAVLVPKTALIERDGATIVRCAKAEGGPFEERRVVVGIDDGKHVVIRDGLAPGEYVVLEKKVEKRVEKKKDK